MHCAERRKETQMKIKDKEYTIGKIAKKTVEVIEWKGDEKIVTVVKREDGDTAGDAIRRAQEGEKAK